MSLIASAIVLMPHLSNVLTFLRSAIDMYF
jgi:hypothetical protein